MAPFRKGQNRRQPPPSWWGLARSLRLVVALAVGFGSAGCVASSSELPGREDSLGGRAPGDTVRPATTLRISVGDTVQHVTCRPADPRHPRERCDLVIPLRVTNLSDGILHLDWCRFELERREEGGWAPAFAPVCPAILRTRAILPRETIADTVRLQHHPWPRMRSDFEPHDVTGTYRLVRPVYWRHFPPDAPESRGELLPLAPAVSQPFRVEVP